MIIKLFWLSTFCMVASVSFAHTSYPKDIYCPLDSTKFTIMVTASYTTFSQTKDFQKQGAIGDLYESMINSCPKCHYSGYQKDFDTTFLQSAKNDILLIIEPYKNYKMNDVVENEIAAKIHLYFKDKNEQIAYIYLLASYFIRNDSAQKDKRIELQKLSIEYYKKTIENREFDKKETYSVIYYLIGELYRRTNEFNNAVFYYELCLKDENAKDWIKKDAEEQKKLALSKNNDNSI
jgi:Uncharacterized protein conserved in bacteria (DUF2225)